MQLINSNVVEIAENNPVKLIELAGRTCYKSEDKMTESSAIKFFEAMRKSKHFAMMEHGHVSYKVSGLEITDLSPRLLSTPYLVWDYKEGNFYITVSCSHLVGGIRADGLNATDIALYRMMIDMLKVTYLEKESQDLISIDGATLSIISEDELRTALGAQAMYHIYRSFRFICDRAVSHELVRHRVSVAQESQRYCNYSSDKFNSEVTFIAPCDYFERSDEDRHTFLASLEIAEAAYFEQIDRGMLPQMARAVLPNATKTEVVLTMNLNQWVHFLELRSLGTTGKPHPDMKVLADRVLQMLTPQLENFQ